MADTTRARIQIVAANAGLIDASRRELKVRLPGGIVVGAVQTSFERMRRGNDVCTGNIPATPMVAGRAGTQPLDATLDSIVTARSVETLRA